MHPIIAQEMLRGFERDLQEKVGSPRRPRASSRKRWLRRLR